MSEPSNYKYIKRVCVLSIVLFGLAVQSHADYINREAAIIVKKFVRVHKKLQQSSVSTLVVLPFESNSSDLKHRNIGLGVAELITNALVNYGQESFRIIERNQLEKILTEQQLSLTGLTESSTQKIGQLLAAQMMVTGKVSKTEESYSITLKLTTSQEGKILATHTSEFPIKEFEDQAVVKKVIVPRKKSIGFYLAYRYMPVSVVDHGVPIKEGDLIISDVEFSIDALMNPVIGNRFYLTERLMGDVSLSLGIGNSSDLEYIVETNIPANNGAPAGEPADYQNHFYDFAVILNWVQPCSTRLDIIVGGGLDLFVLNGSGTAFDYTALIPTARAGFEWRPAQWIGINIMGSYYFQQDIVIAKFHYDTFYAPVPLFKTGQYSIIPAISFYF